MPFLNLVYVTGITTTAHFRGRRWTAWFATRHPHQLNTLFKQDYNHSMWLKNGNASKGADFVNGMVSLRSSLSVFEGARIQNAKESPYTSHSLAISPRITSRLSTWFNMSYEFSFSKNWLEMQSTAMQTAHQSYRQKISGNINPARRWYVHLIGEGI